MHLLGAPADRPGVPAVLADAISARRVLRLRYTDRDGTPTVRDVEPLGFVGSSTGWYLLACCRLREGIRAFRLDRVDRVTATSERAPRRVVRPEDIQVPEGDLRTLTLLG